MTQREMVRPLLMELVLAMPLLVMLLLVMPLQAEPLLLQPGSRLGSPPTSIAEPRRWSCGARGRPKRPWHRPRPRSRRSSRPTRRRTSLPASSRRTSC
jgi:hypothetical protein